MITPANIFLIIIWAFVVPYLAGRLLGMWAKSPAPGLGIGRDLSLGFMVMCALFIVPAIPMILLHAPFSALKYTWVVLILTACVLSVTLSVRRITDRKKPCCDPNETGSADNKDSDTRTETENTDKTGMAENTDKPDEADKAAVPDKAVNAETDIKPAVEKKFDLFTVVIWIAAIAVIIFETGLLTVRMHTDTDDARFIVDAMEAISKNTMLEYNPITGIHHGIPVGEQIKDVTAPYPIFIALMSSLTGVHPAIMAHTVMPLLFIPLSYVVFSLIGGVIFGEDMKKRGLFLFFLSLIHLFSFETIFSAGYTLLTIIWQGRSIVAMIMLPLTWYLLLKMGDGEEVKVRDFALIGISALANAMLSNMGSLFVFILCMAYALSYSIQDRKIKPLIYMTVAMVPDLAVILVSRVLYSGILYK